MKKLKHFFLLISSFFLFTTIYAQNDLKVAAIFCDGMVMQRGVDLPVWGTANANEEVIIYFKNKSYSAKANKKGN